MSAELPWEACGHQVRRRPDGNWSVTGFALGHGRPQGVAIGVEGDAIDATATVRSATRTVRNRLVRVLADGTVVPVKADLLATREGIGEHDTLRALCTVLATHEDARDRLADTVRMSRLVQDLADGALTEMPEHTGARRSTVEVLSAMSALQLKHPIQGRPLRPGFDGNVDTLIARVLDRVAANPYAAGLAIPREVVEELVRRYYLEVTPWPFEALLD